MKTPTGKKRRGWRGVLTSVAVISMVAVLPVAVTSPALGVDLPEGEVDWDAARNLPPLEGQGGTSTRLALTEVRPLTCVEDQCLATTLRPALEAEIEPDADGTWSFAVYDLAGVGGTTAAVAFVDNHPEPTWAPEAGVLQHGRMYVWSAAGAEDQEQPWATFALDLQRGVEQGFDEFGMVSVGVSTGELVVGVGIDFGDDDRELLLEYRSSDWEGRHVGATPLNTMSDGWALSGSALGGATWYALDSYSDGATVIAHAIDGSKVRYERDDVGDYQPPGVEGVDLGHVYPALEAGPGDQLTLSEIDGGVSWFTSSGSLLHYERPAPQGAAIDALDLTWSGELPTRVTKGLTSQEATFSYLGNRSCRPPAGFDVGSPDAALCSITTFDGAVIELFYLDGNLSRVVAPGGAVTDFAYDDSGQLVAVREALAADAVAAGVIPDDDTATWRISYDDAGRVAQVASPSPAPGEEPLERSYSYAEGQTTVFDGAPSALAVVSFDPADYRVLLTQSRDADAPFVRLYGEDRRLMGFIDERDLQTSWETDDSGNVTQQWGPAPSTSFGADGRPLPERADEIPTATATYGGGQGMLGLFYDGMTPGTTMSAQALLTSGVVETLPTAVDPYNGWRLVVLGEGGLEHDDATLWRLTVDRRADPDASGLAVNGMTCAAGEVCELPAPVNEDDAGQAISVWVTYASTLAPSVGTPASFSVEYSLDGGESWVELDVGSMDGRDLETESAYVDVYAPGAAPEWTTRSTSYSDPLLGLVESTNINGTPQMSLGYEPADPANERFARVTDMATASGLTTSIEYWGTHDTAAHPLTGELLPQLGRQKSIQIGDASTYGWIYDASGRVVGTTTNGTTTTAMLFDERGRVIQSDVSAGATALSPARSLHYHYGAGGDPRVTGTTSTVGDDTYVELATVDLLGRIVAETDIWGTTTTVLYDELGLVRQRTVQAADGATSTTTYTVDANLRLVEQRVDAADAGTYGAAITGYDQAGRVAAIEYSNGVSLEIGYDPHTGTPALQRWVDGGGDVWSDELVGSSQSGRILTRDLVSPAGAAAFSYSYDPATGFLTEAEMRGATTTTWSYAYDGIDGARTQRVTTTPEATVTLDYTYDDLLAPVALIETTTPTGGEPSARDISLSYQGADLVAFDGTRLAYDVEGLLVGASDDTTSIELVRDATGAVISQTIADGSRSSTFLSSGPFVLDDAGNTLAEVIGLAAGVSVEVPIAGDATWHYSTQDGNPWWTSGDDGRPTGEATYFSPDGEQLSGADPDPHEIAAAAGWRSGHNGVTLALDTTVVVFGARAYVPVLGTFTTMDPIANAGPTPYSYADNDPVNLVDATGHSAGQWFEDNFGSWNSPGWQVVITIALLAAAVLLAKFGLSWIPLMALAGYYAALSADAFERGDTTGGIIYAVFAALFFVGAGFAGFKGAAAMKGLFAKSASKKVVPVMQQTQRFVGLKTPSVKAAPVMQQSQHHVGMHTANFTHHSVPAVSKVKVGTNSISKLRPITHNTTSYARTQQAGSGAGFKYMNRGADSTGLTAAQRQNLMQFYSGTR